MSPADPISTLMQLRIPQSAALSPSGQMVAYSLSHYDAAADEDHHHLWVVDTSGGAPRQGTHGAQKDRQPQWSPDGRTLAFTSNRGGKAQIYLLPVAGGEARQLTRLAQGVAGPPAWSPDGRWIAFAAPPADPLDPSKPYRLSRSINRFDGIGYLDMQAQDIYIISVTSGDPVRLTDDDCMNNLPIWSPAGDEILYRASMLPESIEAAFVELRVVRPDGQMRRLVGQEWGRLRGSAAWLPDGERIAFIGSPKGSPIGAKSDLYVVDAQGTGAPENRSAGYLYGLGGKLQGDLPAEFFLLPPRLGVSGDGRTAYVQAQVGGEVRLLRVALAGAEDVTTVVGGERSCLLLDAGADSGQLLFAAADFRRPMELYLAASDGSGERRLTAHNDEWLAGWPAVRHEHLLFPGPDSVRVEGWLLTPANGTAPFPTILYIHGGPHGAFGHDFHSDMQMLAASGFAVLMVNQRASTGYGDAFSTAITGDWGNLDYGDLMAGVDAAIAAGLTDPERLGVCGLSGGGNLSCWIVGHSDRFRAAVPENPVTNWLSFYGTSDIGVWFSREELGGDPHEIPETYSRCSPISYAHRCTTPTLLILGEADWRCPAEQGEQFYTVLRANGCVAEMLRLPGGSHGGAIQGPPALRRAQNEALLDWMRRYV